MDTPRQTFSWLNTNKLRMHAVVQLWLDRLHAAMDETPLPALQPELLDGLKSICASVSDELDRARVCLECAWIAHELGLPSRAMEEAKEALHLLKPAEHYDPAYMHHSAMAHWMLGNLHEHASGDLGRALIDWQCAETTFLKLAVSPRLFPTERAWYAARHAEMRHAMDQAVRRIPFPPAPASKPAAPAAHPHSWKFSTLYSGDLASLPVIDRIPAGTPVPLASYPDAIEVIPLHPVMEEFIIEGRPHVLYNMQDRSRVTRLNAGYRYYILGVNGDSMDQASISTRDYVLVRYQDLASTQDIVAAELIDVDHEATLKRYVVVNRDTIELRAESANRKNRSYTFTRQSTDQFILRGVVIGVFKPG